MFIIISIITEIHGKHEWRVGNTVPWLRWKWQKPSGAKSELTRDQSTRNSWRNNKIKWKGYKFTENQNHPNNYEQGQQIKWARFSFSFLNNVQRSWLKASRWINPVVMIFFILVTILILFCVFSKAKCLFWILEFFISLWRQLYIWSQLHLELIPTTTFSWHPATLLA